VIDTHCHLTFADFAGALDATMAEAAASGVTGAITISTTTQDCLRARDIALAHPRVWHTAGVHPLYAGEGPHEWGNLRACFESPKCVAWGELGLDNHYDDPPKDIQRAVLDEQLAFIEACGRGEHGAAILKPIVLHCRKAFDDLIPILARTALEPGRFVFHCFTGNEADMGKLLDFGAMVSFTGVITYKNAAEVRAAAKMVPCDRIMVETDAPYLSPEPLRSQRPCKPAMVALTARALAECRGERFEDLHAAINANTARFFGIDAR